MNVALTGASGYTGQHLLRALRLRGDRVTVLVRPQSITTELTALASRVVPGDLRDQAAIESLVQGAEGVLHVAAVYRTAGHPDSYYREVNLEGSRRLFEAALRHGVERLVHTSTVGVHGHIAHAPADEDAPYSPGDIYQETKAEADRLALALHRERGLPVAIVRPGAIYGPGETRLLKLFRAIAHSRYAIVGTGRTFYHPVFIDDLVQGFLLALDHPRAVGEAFIIAGPRYVSQRELADTVARHTGGRVWPFRIPATPLIVAGSLCEALCVPLGIEPPLHRRRMEFWVKSRAFSTDKARRILGYAPEVDWDEGVRRTAAAYREAGWL
jgi:dihydroflavonol-4-reductase